MDAVVASHVGKVFPAKPPVRALSDVSLRIKKGEIYGLLGPNGAGKTTLITILVGLTTAEEGSVTVCGKDIRKQLHEVQKEINLIRGFSGVLERFTAYELLTYYTLLYDVPHSRVEIALRRVGLWERRNERIENFSSGWRQRFFFAKGLLNEPKVLFMDEPTVGLDVDTAIEMRQLIKKLNKEGYTILLTTHYMREAEELCDRIALISDGRIVAEGTAKELKRRVTKDEAILITGELDRQTLTELKAVKGVEGVAQHGDTVRLLVSSKSVMKPVMKLLSGSAVHVDSVKRDEPTLEDVFLKLTKRGLEAHE